MGVQVPPLKRNAKHRIVIGLTGQLSKRDAAGLKKALDAVLDRYRPKCGKVTPPPPKGPKSRWKP